MTSRQQLLTAFGASVAALAVYAVVGAYGGPHVVGAVIGLTVRHHALQALARWV